MRVLSRSLSELVLKLLSLYVQQSQANGFRTTPDQVGIYLFENDIDK